MFSCGSDEDPATTTQSSSGGNTQLSCHESGYCLLFVTATTTKGNTSGVSGADTLCNNDANKPDSGNSYKALVVDGTNRIACTSADCSGGISENTDWVLSSNKEYRRADKTTVIGTTDASGIFSFPLTNSFHDSSTTTFTGLNTNWTSGTGDCSDWTFGSGGGGGGGDYSDPSLTSSGSIKSANNWCGAQRSLICVEQA